MIASAVRIVPSAVTVKIVITVNRVIDASNAESQDDVKTLLSCWYVINVMDALIASIVWCAQIVISAQDVVAVVIVPTATIVLDATILVIAATISTISNTLPKNTIRYWKTLTDCLHL